MILVVKNDVSEKELTKSDFAQDRMAGKINVAIFDQFVEEPQPIALTPKFYEYSIQILTVVLTRHQTLYA